MEASSSRLDSIPRPSRIPIRYTESLHGLFRDTRLPPPCHTRRNHASKGSLTPSSSTPSSSSRLPTLPPELITDIFRDSNLTSTDLSSLSLVSHSHLPSIRRTLFREITIVHSVLLKPHNQLRLTRASLTLISYLSTHPEIASLVQGVEFRVRKRTKNLGRLYDESVQVEDGQETIERVLKLVPNLSHLSISYCFCRIADLVPFLSTHCPEISTKINPLSVWSLDEQECLELSTLFPRLRHVTTRASNPYGMFEYHLDRRMSRTLSQLTNLANPSMPEFIPFLLSSSKSLRSLSTHFDNLRELDLKELFPNLKELYVTTITELPWPERGYDPPSDIIFLFRQLQHSTCLETLKLRGPYEELPPRPNPEDYPDFWGEEEDRIPSCYNILRAENVTSLKRIVLEGKVNGMRVEQVLAFPMEGLRELVLPRYGVEELEEIREIVRGKNRGKVELRWNANDPIDPSGSRPSSRLAEAMNSQASQETNDVNNEKDGGGNSRSRMDEGIVRVSLPYLPLPPPTRYELEHARSSLSSSNENSTSAKSLALFHLGSLAINTLPRSSWKLSISNISQSTSSSLSNTIQELELDRTLKKVQVWTADLTWTLSFGSIDASSMSDQAGKPLGGAQNGSESYDDWVSVGEKRKVELVFVEVEPKRQPFDEGGRKNGGKGKGKGKERAIDDHDEKRTQLVHVRLSLPPGSITPRDLLELLPGSVQGIVGFFFEVVVGPVFLYIAFKFLRYFHLDQASDRFRSLGSPPTSSSTPTSTVEPNKSPQRSRSRTRRHLTGRSPPLQLPSPVQKDDLPLLSSTPPFSLAPSIPPLHVELPVPKPSREEQEALEILRGGSGTNRSDRLIVQARAQAQSENTRIPTTSRVDHEPWIFSIFSFLSIPFLLVRALVLETSDLYYLIARFVVLFTQVVWAAGGIAKEIVVGTKHEFGRARGGGEERAQQRGKRSRGIVPGRKGKVFGERLGRISENEEEEEVGEGEADLEFEVDVGIVSVGMEETGEESVEIDEPVSVEPIEKPKPAEIDRVAISRGSPPLSPTPPVYHHPRLRGKRVSFPSLFATVIGQSSSDPQISLPPSPSHSPAPRPPAPPTPPPSIATSYEDLSSPVPAPASREEPIIPDEYSTDPRMYNLPLLATNDSPESVLHFRVSQEAASIGKGFPSSLSLKEHGIDRSGLGEKEFEISREVGKGASEVGKSVVGDLRRRFAVEEREDALRRKREESIEEGWDRESKEEGMFGDEVEERERRKMKNLVGKEASEIGRERSMDPEEEEIKLKEIEKQVEERRRKMVEEALEIEGQMKEEEDSAVEEESEEGVIRGEKARGTVLPSASDYPTPSSRRSDEPFPLIATSSFEPASPPETTSAMTTGPGPSPATSLRELEEVESSPPTSPEITRESNVANVAKPGGAQAAVGAVGSSKGDHGAGSGVEGTQSKEPELVKREKSKSKKKKGRK
ncbi:hypothetical protein JCM16303_004079 [Sporobolomyces ruberrimus]